jgi:type II secretory pathway component PulJ
MWRGSTTHSRERGMTLIEIVVALGVMAFVLGGLTVIVGAATRSKMIVAVRAADTETARQTLEWMAERLRNAGLNVLPGAQSQVRCQDMIVAQDVDLRPQADRVYVSGEILNSDTVAGNEVITLGYRLQEGRVIEDRGPCTTAWAPATAVVSNPSITVTGLAFEYFTRNGDPVAVPTTDIEAIRSIRVIRVGLTVQGQEGTSGVQTQAHSRLIMLRNPRPDTNNWVAGQETNP